MEQYKGINIYTQTDFEPGCTITRARSQLESSERGPSLIIFDRQVSGVNIHPGAHTRAIADVLAALLSNAGDDAEASGTTR
jgi:hypothetical protein